MKKSIYLALGDSIATGTLTPFSRVVGYTGYLYNTLNRQRPTRMVNLAKDGDTTGDLLGKLLWSPAFRSWVRRADVITLSIGGNNLMHAVHIPGFTGVNLKRAEAGTRAFCIDWERIITELRSLNPTCPLLVMTIYNPYNETNRLGATYGADRGMRELTARYLTRMNGTIRSACHGRYRIAEIDTLFEPFANGRMGAVVNLYPSGLYLLRNPHPTPYGHRRIARAHLALLEEPGVLPRSLPPCAKAPLPPHKQGALPPA